MDENKHLNFLFSIALLIISIYILISGYGMYKEAGEPLHVSPALLPVILGGALLLCCVLQIISILKTDKFQTIISDISQWSKNVFSQKVTFNMIIGTLIMGIYTFVLLYFLPFWLASVIFMICLMLFLKAASVLKSIILSGVAIALIVLLFQNLFRVPLP